MVEWLKMNEWLQKNFDKLFSNMCLKYNIIIKKDDMNIVTQIMKDNPYPLFNNEYAPILLLEIKVRTNADVSEKIRGLLDNNEFVNAIHEHNAY